MSLLLHAPARPFAAASHSLPMSASTIRPPVTARLLHAVTKTLRKAERASCSVAAGAFQAPGNFSVKRRVFCFYVEGRYRAVRRR